jgi:NAD(P)-dependent dehydrogenase (short-subunit alcohol dehydrogenase family)
MGDSGADEAESQIYGRGEYITMKTIAELFDLSGKGAVVTGGAMGIGQGIALRLAEAGANVMVADINLKAATQTAQQIEARGGKAQAIRADVCSPADAEKVARATVDAFGSLDILVNNAGIFPSSRFLDTSEESWDKVLDINLKGVFLYSQAAARVMIKAGHGGKIINIASMEALKPMGGHTHYGASKSGVAMLTKSMALELAANKILVNAVAPGGIQTPGSDVVSSAMSQALGMTEEGLMQAFLQRVPLGRLGEPDDIAKVVLFLASGAADFITGELILIDGGHLLC